MSSCEGNALSKACEIFVHVLASGTTTPVVTVGDSVEVSDGSQAGGSLCC